MAIDGIERKWWPVLVHSARTAVAAVASVLVARLFRLPEAYWAPITTLVIKQSSLGAALEVSWQRFVGTALGAVLGAIAAATTSGRDAGIRYQRLYSWAAFRPFALRSKRVSVRGRNAGDC